MSMSYFVFDASDDHHGQGTWEAVASVRVSQLAEAQEEAQHIMAAVQADAPGPRGPSDEGGTWDIDLHIENEGEWTSLYLTITGPWPWGEALMGRLEAPLN